MFYSLHMQQKNMKDWQYVGLEVERLEKAGRSGCINRTAS